SVELPDRRTGRSSQRRDTQRILRPWNVVDGQHLRPTELPCHNRLHWFSLLDSLTKASWPVNLISMPFARDRARRGLRAAAVVAGADHPVSVVGVGDDPDREARQRRSCDRQSSQPRASKVTDPFAVDVYERTHYAPARQPVRGEAQQAG